MTRDPLERAREALAAARSAAGLAERDRLYRDAAELADRADTVDGRLLSLRSRLERLAVRTDAPRTATDWSERAADREAFEAAVEEALSLASEAETGESRSLAAWACLQRADDAWDQYTDWESFDRWCRRAAAFGEACGTPEGLEAAAEARWLLGRRLDDYADTDVPTDRSRGERELSDAVRLGRASGTPVGFQRAVEAGLRLVDLKDEAGDGRAADGLRDGVCRTREQARDRLEPDDVARLDAAIRETVGQDPDEWCGSATGR